MKKISIMLMVVFSLFLAACTNTTEKQNNSAIEVTFADYNQGQRESSGSHCGRR